MGSYLPKDGSSSSAYQDGGGLYALGMKKFFFFYEALFNLHFYNVMRNTD